MKKIIFSLILTSILLFSCQGQKKEEKLVRESFDSYKSAILSDKGDEAANFVDSRTIWYYSEILDKTKNADSTEVNSLGIMDKFMVFSIRHQTPKEDILSFDGKGLFVYAIKEGMVSKNSVASTEIGKVEIDGNFAKGQLISKGEIVPFYFHFYKEEDIWKIDLTSIFPIAIVAFKNMVDESGLPENEYLFMLLEILKGRYPGNEIWQTIK